MSIQINRTNLDTFVLPFAEIDSASLSTVGGKGANLGEMTRAGLPVPPGFCVTTAAYALVTESAGLEPLLGELASLSAEDTDRIEALANSIRTCVLSAPIPEDLAQAITSAYARLEDGSALPVAVRSSATAEDLPFASFAGQQDTYLNIVGDDALLDAVRRCWASLWTDRAISYRISNRIDHHSVRLSVVVQQMIASEVAGVLFTANPVTGRRQQAVIDANPGLGEAVVSGAVNPDRFIVNTPTGEIVERHAGDKQLIIRSLAGGGTERIERASQNKTFCLTDEQVRALAQLGARVETHYGSPQDTEWAIDGAGHLWLTQARPITTLYPLPEGAPTNDEQLRVYFSFNVAQGVNQPLTPMGITGIRLISSSGAIALGMPPADLLAGAPAIVVAGERLFMDITTVLRNTLGRELLQRIFYIMETRSAAMLLQLRADPRLKPTTGSITGIRTLLGLLVRTRVPLYALQALLSPTATRRRVFSIGPKLRRKAAPAANITASERVTMAEQLLVENAFPILPSMLPIIIVGLGSFFLANRLLAKDATPAEMQTVLRALPYNPTTEMDLALWKLAQKISTDAQAAQVLRSTPSEQLVSEYHANKLPATLQGGLAEFLKRYGHRGVAEIDLGLPRWSEDPTHILGVLNNYLRLADPEMAPDRQFERGKREAEQMVAELTRRAYKHSWLHGMLISFCLKRVRALGGLREMPKFYIIQMFDYVRKLLWPVGDELVQQERLEKAEDIFFLTMREVQEALAGSDMRGRVQDHRASYEHELYRRHIPRILLSDGTEPAATKQASQEIEGTLTGSPASPGSITARARVVLNPTGAHLEPGEILVAPSTDPGWTPLFLTAGGLVMEMGGAMSHGAVVAREYGIPAVVGVSGAIDQITTGQMITVDGSNGLVIPATQE